MKCGRKDIEEFLAGAKDAIPIVIGYLTIGFAFGALAQKVGLSTLEIVMMSIFVYAGSAQFIAVSLISAGAALPVLVSTTFLVNLRHLLFSSALVQKAQEVPVRLLAPLSYELTDESFAVAISRSKGHKLTPAYLMGLFPLSHSGWVLGSYIGCRAADLIADPNRFGLDYTLTAMFIFLAVTQISSKTMIIVAAIAAVISSAIVLAGNTGINAITAICIAATLGVLIDRWKRR